MSQAASAGSLPPVVVVSAPGIDSVPRRFAVAQAVTAGTLLGLMWGASLRAWMALLALHFGEPPTFTWAGTFGAILLPAALAGAWLGWAATDSRAGRRWRWALLSPLLMVLGPLLFLEGFIPALMQNGMGGGAIAVALVGILGGVADSGLGPRWARWVAGLLAGATSVGLALFTAFIDAPPGGPSAAGTALTVLLGLLLMLFLIAGVSLPAWSAARRSTPHSDRPAMTTPP